MSWETIFKVFTTGLGALVGYLFGGWNMALQTLLFFMGLDYATGLFASYIEGGWSSKVGFKGIARKVFILCIVSVCHQLDGLLGSGNTIYYGGIFFYVGNELISIIENAGRAKVPLPQQLMDAVEVLKGKKAA